MSTARFVLIVAAIGCAIIALHVVDNLRNQHNPPLACVLVGGHWSIMDGWQCN